MVQWIEYLKALVLGIVEGITEWLPISSTGHMILVDEFLKLNMSDEFKELFLVVIQLGAILAVVLLYFKTLWPLKKENGRVCLSRETMVMWGKILISCIPAAVVGLLLDDLFNRLFYNWQTVAIMLVVFGVLFLWIERYNRGRTPRCHSIAALTLRDALLIGVFQVIAAIFPGVSRSGATILGALLLGVSRTTAAEYTFYLAIPVMFGASLLKLLKFGLAFSTAEMIVLAIGLISAFAVSVAVIKFLMGFIRKHDFSAFGWYRIVLGAVVILYFLFAR